MGSQGDGRLFIVAFFDNPAAASVATRAALQAGATTSDVLDVGLLALDAAGGIVVSTTRGGEPQRDGRLQVAVGRLAHAATSQDHVEADPTNWFPLDLTNEDVARIVAELEAGQGAVAVISDRSDGHSLVLCLTGLGRRVEVHGFTRANFHWP